MGKRRKKKCRYMKEASKAFSVAVFHEDYCLYYSRLRYLGKQCIRVDGKKA